MNEGVPRENFVFFLKKIDCGIFAVFLRKLFYVGPMAFRNVLDKTVFHVILMVPGRVSRGGVS